MNNIPPAGSRITFHRHDSHQIVVVPQASGGVARYFVGVFLIFWLTGWFSGFTSALQEIISGQGGFFLIFWLGGWSIGGLFAVYMAYRAFSRPKPERLLLNRPSLCIDTGVPPLTMNIGFSGGTDRWDSLFPNRRRLELDHSDLKSLRLRENEKGSRLTVDQGSARIELASSASEVEREWLYQFLKHNYS